MMLRVRFDSADTSRGIRYSGHSILLEILGIIVKTVPLVLIFSLLIWTLTKYGERSLEETRVECNDRSRPMIGFEGDSDFYGPGIRLGLYLQWASSFITNCFTPTEREPVIVTYIIFSLSITVAVLARTFGQQCTFVAEMFVVLTMFWGGLNILLVPMLRGMALDRLTNIPSGESYVAMFNQGSQGLKWTLSLLNFFMSPITIWFWGRLAVVGEKDFAPTPGNTSLFFFARIQEHGVKSLSIFMTIASVVNFVWFVYVMLPLRMDPNLENVGVESMVGGAIWLCLNTLLFPFWFFHWLVSMLLMVFVATLSICFKISMQMIARRRNFHDVIESIDARSSFNPGQNTGREATAMIRYESGLPLLISVWCIVGIELTLRWNLVTEVYSVNSTGQVIPFVTGLGVFLVSLWKSTKRLLSSNKRSDENGDVELGSYHGQSENAFASGDAKRSARAHIKRHNSAP